MKNILLTLSVAACAISCGTTNVSGLYKTQDCDEYARDCFMYSFKNDGNFTYWYSNSTIGEITLYGTYYILGKHVKLIPNKYIFHDTTKILFEDKKDQNKTRIKISLIPGYLKNKPDTMHIPWLVKINDAPFFSETDDEGILISEKTDIQRIEIKDYSSKFELDNDTLASGTVFEINEKNKDININLASDILEPIVIPPVKQFLIKGKKLIAIKDKNSGNNMFEASTNIYIKE